MQNKISYISNDDTGVKFKLISFCCWSLKARRCDCHNVLLLKVRAIFAQVRVRNLPIKRTLWYFWVKFEGFLINLDMIARFAS